MSTTIPTVEPPATREAPTAQTQVHLGPTPSELSPTRQYLVMYNLFSFILWFSLPVRILGDLSLSASIGYMSPNENRSSVHGVASVYQTNGTFAKWIQTIAIAEVLHSLFGLVRAPALTTAMQVASRLLLVWGVVGMFGDDLLMPRSGIVGQFKSMSLGDTGLGTPNQTVYLVMLMAWSATECVRYLYFVISLGNGNVPEVLKWLRYNMFFVLYPVGISCECWLIYHALPFARQWNDSYAWLLIGILGIYVPGSYILFTHMMTQRRRLMKGKQKEKTR